MTRFDLESSPNYDSSPSAYPLPTSEDQRKMNAEVNQIINQRFVITLTTITVFGAVGAWMIPKIPPQPSSDLGGFVFFASSLLLSLLFVLFLYSHILRGRLKVISSYLILSGTTV